MGKSIKEFTRFKHFYFMGKALFKVLILCLYIRDNGISFGEVL